MTLRGPEQVIIEALLDAIVHGRLNCLKDHETQLREIALEARMHNSGSSVRLKNVLLGNGQIGEAAVDEMTRITLDFISSEIKKYASIRAIRELTDEEKQYGQNTLPHLLNSLRSLIKDDSTEPNSQHHESD